MGTTVPYLSSTLVIDPVEGDLALIYDDSLMSLAGNTSIFVPVVCAVTAFGIFCLIGLLAVLVFIVVLVVGRSKFDEFPFFVLIWNMTVANGIHITLVVCSIIPLMIFDTDDTEDNVLYVWPARLMELTEQATLYITLIMTINRFAVFVFPHHSGFFTKFRLWVMCAIMWLYVLFIVTWNVNFATIKIYNRKKAQATSDATKLLGNNSLTQFFTISSTALPFIMMGMYGIIVLAIVKKRNSTENVDKRKLRRDKSFLYQVLVITLALELTKVCSMINPYFSGASTVVTWLWTVFNFSTAVFNQMINPVMSLLYNKMIRGVFFRLFSQGTQQAWISESSTNSNSGFLKPSWECLQHLSCCCCCGSNSRNHKSPLRSDVRI